MTTRFDEHTNADKAYIVLGWLNGKDEQFHRIMMRTGVYFECWQESSYSDRFDALIDEFHHHTGEGAAALAIQTFCFLPQSEGRYKEYWGVGVALVTDEQDCCNAKPKPELENFVTQEALEKTLIDHQKAAAEATSAMVEKYMADRERERECEPYGDFSKLTETIKNMPVVEVAPKQPDVFDFALSCLQIAADSKESRVYADFDSGVRFGEFVCALHKMLSTPTVSTPTGTKEAA